MAVIPVAILRKKKSVLGQYESLEPKEINSCARIKNHFGHESWTVRTFNEKIVLESKHVLYFSNDSNDFLDNENFFLHNRCYYFILQWLFDGF